jgi:signal transduction histidine kinase
MDSPRPHSQVVPVVAGASTAALGVLVLAGWTWQIDALKALSGPETMTANAAIGIVLCGTSLVVFHHFPRWARFFAMCAGTLGACTLAEHALGIDLGIDRLFFSSIAGEADGAARMGVNASTSFVLVAVALSWIARSRHVGTAQTLALLSLSLTSLPFIGYVYAAEEFYGLVNDTGIALHSAAAFVLLDVGILAARSFEGPVAVFRGCGPAGTMLRRLALPIIAVPPLLGYLFVLGRTTDFIDRGTDLALFAIALIFVLGLTVWHTAGAIERSERARRDAERDRDLLIVSERSARADAERANQVKDHFLATLSHELRTPLNVMLGWTQVLEDTSKPVNHARIAAIVAKNGRLLGRLVEDLLDISRITSGQFEISSAPVNLNTISQMEMDSVAAEAGAKALTLMLDADPAVTLIDADAQRLQQIVSNLLSNSVKFTPAGGQVIMRTRRRHDSVTLTITDTGSGFDRSFAPDLFTPFRQADSSTRREHGGLGLGLSISKHLAELHGGTLTGVSDGVGRGATFTLTLPAAPLRTADPAPPAASRGTAEMPRERALAQAPLLLSR